MAIVDREVVKLFLNISGSDYDERIDALIPQVEQDFLNIRGVPFDEDSNDQIEYPDSHELISSRMIGFMLSNMTFNEANYSNKQSESIGSYSYTKKAGNEKEIEGYPAAIVRGITRYQRFN